MAVDGINKWTPSQKVGEFACVSTIFSPSVENERAGARRDDRTRLARPNSLANGGGENTFFSVQMTTSRVDNHTRFIHTLMKVLVEMVPN